MKRVLLALLATAVLLSAVACNGDGTVESKATKDAAETTTTAASPEPAEPAEPPEPEAEFYAGYARVDITPTQSVPIESNMSTTVSDKNYATVIAVSDGETKALFITTDLRHSKDPILRYTLMAAEKNGVPSDNVFLCATHNHSTITYDDSNSSAMFKWKKQFQNAIEEGIEAALADLTPTTAKIGVAHTENFAFVRRYIMEDGSFKGIHTNNPSTAYARHETEADDEMQVIRFEREGARDIVMVNWQAHPAHAVDMFPTMITSDFVHFFREDAEKLYDVNFAFFQGASGNINLHSYVSGKQIYNNYIQVGHALAERMADALDNMEKVKLGKINVERMDFDAQVDHSQDALYDIALEVYRESDSAKQKELINKYGFQSKYEAISIIQRHNYGATKVFSLSAISFGDLGFASTPYEMFDTNGMEVKEGSPFKMTFVCSCTNGAWSYIAADHAYENGGYEVYNCKFVRGTAEKVVGELLKMLQKQYDTIK